MKKYIKNSLIFIFVISFTAFTNAEFRLGVDYRIVDNPLPVKRDGVVEVSETFWYGCNACYQFDPVINAWESRPMIIVDGKYIIEPKGSYEKLLKVVDHVVELQRPNS